MRILAGIAGFLFVALALADAFITIVLTRRTRHTMQLARGFYRLSWSPFSATARHIASGAKSF